MDAHGIAVVNGLSVDAGGGAGELEFARDDFLGEISLADEVGNDVNFLGVDHVKSFPHRGLFLPKAAMDFAKNVALADFAGVVKVGG